MIHLNISPVSHGNHNNIWFTCSIKNVIKFKAVAMLDSQKVYITGCNMADKLPNKLKSILDASMLYKLLEDGFNDLDFKLMTAVAEILTYRDKLDQKEFVKPIYEIVSEDLN